MTLGAQHDPKMLYEYSLLKKGLHQTDELKFVWKCKGTKVAKTILEKNKVRRLAISNFKRSVKLQ